MKPDVVILGFVFNDLYYKYLHKPTKNEILGREPSRRLNRFDVDTLPGVLFSRSYLAHGIVHTWDLSVKKLTKFPYFPFDYRSVYLAWKDYAWKKENELIGKMNGVLKKESIEFIVVCFPISNQVDDKYLKLNRDYVLFPQKKITEICRYHEIQFLDLTGAIYENGGTRLFKDYLHLNGNGNDVVAREITDYLSAKL